MKRILIFVVICLLGSCKEGPKKVDVSKSNDIHPGPVKVTMIETEGKFQLLVNNEEFYIKGAGLEFGNITALAKHKANSFRTWRTDNGEKSALEVLDEAYENGLMVTMGIEVGRERHGFDYNDPIMVEKQLQSIKEEVIALKNHPALLIWGIGNELNLHYENPKVWDAVNQISEMIHEVDPNHLTTTSLAGLAQKEVSYIKERCSDLDILSVQMYGDLPQVPSLIRKFGWDGPYMVTEWGATGHWEVPTTAWGAPIEQNSTVKAANYLQRHETGIASDKEQCIGSYVFLWGNKQERTPTWYGIFLEDGQETESVDVMHYIWNSEWPENRTPAIVDFKLNGKTASDNVYLVAGAQYISSITMKDYESDPLEYSWEILPESTDLKDGGDEEERPGSVKDLIVEQQENTVNFKAPSKGAYRLFVYVGDGHNHSAAANIPFMVK